MKTCLRKRNSPSNHRPLFWAKAQHSCKEYYLEIVSSFSIKEISLISNSTTQLLIFPNTSWMLLSSQGSLSKVYQTFLLILFLYFLCKQWFIFYTMFHQTVSPQTPVLLPSLSSPSVLWVLPHRPFLTTFYFHVPIIDLTMIIIVTI